VHQAVASTNWRAYGLSQSNGSLPAGPVTLVVHMASVWVPFTSESKEAIAAYPEILREMKLALQEVGRKLGSYLRGQRRQAELLRKHRYIERYLPHIGIGLREILGLSDKQQQEFIDKLQRLLERSRT
jgi:DNA topoisomerase-6 subunit B